MTVKEIFENYDNLSEDELNKKRVTKEPMFEILL